MPTPKKPIKKTGNSRAVSKVTAPMKELPASKKPTPKFGQVPKMTAAEAKKADANKKKAISEYSKNNPVKGTIAEMKRTGDKNVKAIKKSVKSGLKEASSNRNIERAFGYNASKMK